MRAAGIGMSCSSRRVRELPIRMMVTTGLVLGSSIELVRGLVVGLVPTTLLFLVLAG